MNMLTYPGHVSTILLRLPLLIDSAEPCLKYCSKKIRSLPLLGVTPALSHPLPHKLWLCAVLGMHPLSFGNQVEAVCWCCHFETTVQLPGSSPPEPSPGHCSGSCCGSKMGPWNLLSCYHHSQLSDYEETLYRHRWYTLGRVKLLL